MSLTMRGLLMFGLLVVALPSAALAADEKDEMVDNPKYKVWAKFKPGATAVHIEKNVLHGEEKADFPGGVDEKTITYTLLSSSEDKVVVKCVVTETDHLGTIEQSPTKITYPAKIKKSNLAAALDEFGAKIKDETEMVKAAGKDLKCMVVEGKTKKGDDAFEFKLCFCYDVPGGLVKRSRTAKRGDKVTAETTITLKSFKEGGKSGKGTKAPTAPK
jgi:hypothetical protein